MIDPKPHPSSLLHKAAVVARWALAGLLGVWFLLAATAGVLHGFIVPRIGDYRVQLETLAAKALGAPVRIGSVTAYSDGLVPSLELNDVALLDAQGQAALQLPKVLVAVSARSVWRKGVEQIVLESPQLEIKRRADGRWEVAGLLQQDTAEPDNSPLEWVLAQPEIAVRNGVLRWSDALRGTPAQQLEGVDIVLRGGHWRHALRMDARLPEAQGGSTVQVLGEFRQPLLALGGAPWEHWNGQWFVQGTLQQLPQLPLPEEWNVQQVQAQGDIRLWVDVRKGALAGMTGDVRMPQASVAWNNQQPALALRHVAGRLDVQAVDGGWQAHATGWKFAMDDGIHWPSSDITLRWPQAGGEMLYGLEASFLDLAITKSIAQRLPLPDKVAEQLQRWDLQGRAQAVQVHWQPALKNEVVLYQAKGQLQGVTLRDLHAGSHTPGLEGADLRFTLDQQGGSADVEMRQGALAFPGIFEEPRIPIQQLQASVRWSQDAAGRWSVQVPQARFGNADAQGHLQARWSMGADAANRLPGELQLEGVLSRANGARVHRYLPLEIPQDARHYVRDSVRSGSASNVRFKVAGPLAHFPFEQGGKGVFHIAAPVRDVVYDYVPPRVRAAGDAPWPLITQLTGDLVFDQAGMQVRNARGWFGEVQKVPLEAIEAKIPDLSHPVLDVSGHGKAALPAWLDVVARSPLAGLTEHALDHAISTGPATLKLALHLPIDQLEKSRVTGTVGLQGNQLRFRPDVPQLQNMQGAVQFSEKGFALQEVRAQALGGSVRVVGGLQIDKGTPVLHIEAKGRATAEGLHTDGFLAPVAALAQHASGATDYEVKVGLQRALPQVLVRSSLKGLALNLPAPLGKAAEESVPLQVVQQLTPAAAANPSATLQDMLQVHVQGRAALTYVFDQKATPARVAGGWIQLGGDVGAPGAWPAGWMGGPGVQAQAQLGALDVDAWQALLAAPPPAQAAGAEVAEATATEAQAYLPQRVVLRADSVKVHGRALHEVEANVAQREGVWRGDVQSRQLAGYGEYHPAGGAYPQGLVLARLSRLLLPESAADQADTLLQSQPRQMPALDISVKELAIAGRALGSLAVQAQNQRRNNHSQWVLNRFDLSLPEATLTARGTWGGEDAAQRRTQLRFTLALQDSGALLERFGMPGVIRGGKGQLEGLLGWRGAPIAPDWKGMGGTLHLDVGQGQFLKAEPGLAKLLSVLSLQSLPRRIGLDFRDVFSSGFAFDFVRGDLEVSRGVARTNNLQMKGVNAAVLMEGQASLVDETQQLRVVVVPEINAMTASLVATAINPVIGLGSFLAQAVLRGPLIAAATREFEVSGSWSEPEVRALERGARKMQATPAQSTLPEAAAPAALPSALLMTSPSASLPTLKDAQP